MKNVERKTKSVKRKIKFASRMYSYPVTRLTSLPVKLCNV